MAVSAWFHASGIPGERRSVYCFRNPGTGRAVRPYLPLLWIFTAISPFPLCATANLITGYRTAPHVDIGATQAIAAALLCRAIRENVLPWASLVKIPMLQPGEAATTDTPHVRRILADIDAIQRMDGVWRTSYFTGMSWIDCPHNGSTIVVCGTAKERAPIESAMCSAAQNIWETRHDFQLSSNSLKTEDAVRMALESPQKIVFLSDSGDNVTAGATGDNAFMLKLLYERNAQNVLVAGLWDEVAVSACEQAGIGAVMDITLGARHQPCRHSGNALRGRGQTLASEFLRACGRGRVVCFRY